MSLTPRVLLSIDYEPWFALFRHYDSLSDPHQRRELDGGFTLRAIDSILEQFGDSKISIYLVGEIAGNEFIQWYLLQDYVPLLSLPRQASEAGFFIPEVDVTSADYSAFNTHDFQGGLKPFNKYGYAMKKIMERVRDLAILHSSLSTEEGRLNTQRRFEAFLEAKFRGRLAYLIERCQMTDDPDRKLNLKLKMAELSRRITEAKRIWERYAPRDS